MKVQPGLFAFGNQRIGHFPDAVVKEDISMICSRDEPRPDCFLNLGIDSLRRSSENETRSNHLNAASQTSKPLKDFLCCQGETVQLPSHEFCHVVRVTLGANSLQVPGPGRFCGIEN